METYYTLRHCQISAREILSTTGGEPNQIKSNQIKSYEQIKEKLGIGRKNYHGDRDFDRNFTVTRDLVGKSD